MSLQVFDEVLAESFAVVFDDSNSPGVLGLTDSNKVMRRVDTILVSSNDTVDQVIRLRFSQGGTYYWIGSVTIPAGTGFGGTPSIDLLAAVLPATQIGINLFAFTILEIYAETAISSGKGVWVTSFGGTF